MIIIYSFIFKSDNNFFNFYHITANKLFGMKTNFIMYSVFISPSYYHLDLLPHIFHSVDKLKFQKILKIYKKFNLNLFKNIYLAINLQLIQNMFGDMTILNEYHLQIFIFIDLMYLNEIIYHFK